MIKLPESVGFLLFVSLFTTSSAFGDVCERERREFVDWSSRCEELLTASKAAGSVVGGIFEICTFELQMIPCAAAVAAAQNSCQTRDEKWKHLSSCETHFAMLSRQAEEENQAKQMAKFTKGGRVPSALMVPHKTK